MKRKTKLGVPNNLIPPEFDFIFDVDFPRETLEDIRRRASLLKTSDFPPKTQFNTQQTGNGK